jgi:hypothetical protein
MIKHLNILNILLFVVLLSLVSYTYTRFVSASNVEFNLDQTRTKKSNTIKNLTSETKLPPMSEYVVINEKNLFHPDRKPLNKKIYTGTGEGKPEIILYGTVIDGKNRIAFIEDKQKPFSTAGRGIRQRAVKIGDIISGYRVKEIKEDSIVLVSADEELVFRIDEPTKYKHSQAVTIPKKTKQRPKRKQINTAREREFREHRAVRER